MTDMKSEIAKLYVQAMENLRSLEGEYVPLSTDTMSMVYPEENVTDERLPRLAVKWRSDRSLVMKELGVELMDVPYEKQGEYICDARTFYDREMAEQNKPTISESADERLMREWREGIPSKYKSAAITDFPSAYQKVNHILFKGSMLMLGPTGTGKTRFLWACASEVKKRVPHASVKVIGLQELLSKVRSRGGDWNEAAEEMYGSLDWLFVDECDKVNGSENDYIIVSGLVNKRYENELPTIFAGNGTREQMISKLGEPTVSRLTAGNENGLLFLVKGADRRNTRT